MYFRPLFIRIDQSILNIQAIVIPNISKFINLESGRLQQFFKSHNLPVIFSKKYIIFLPAAKVREENLRVVSESLRPLIFLAKNEKMRSGLKDIVENPELSPLSAVVDVNDVNRWINVVAALRKSFLNGLSIRRLLDNGKIAGNLTDPKSNINFDVSLSIKLLRIPPDFPITMVCGPKVTASGSKDRVALSKRGKSLVLEKFREFASKLQKVSFYIGGTKIDLSNAEVISDIIDLREDSVSIPIDGKIPTFLEIHRSVIDVLSFSSSIKRLYHHGREEVYGHPYRDLQELLPYDASFKKFRKIRMVFAISSSEETKVKELFQKFHKELADDPNSILKFLGVLEEIKSFLELEILEDIVEFDSVDDLINKLNQSIRPLSEALRQEEADIVIVGTSAYRGAPQKSGAKEKYDEIRRSLLEHGYPNQFISYYSGSGTPMGLLAQFENKNSGYEYSLGNLMLNIYSKVSGRPWAIRQDRDFEAHAIIALGFARSNDKKFGVGVSVVIGEYGDLVQVGSWDLPDSVLQSKNLFVERDQMREIISDIADGIKRSKSYLSRVNLVVYKYGRYSEDELQGMRDAINEFGSSELRISPISIQREGVYPGSKIKYVRLTHRSVLFSPLRNAYASVAVLWPLGNNYDFYSDLQGVVNNIEALLRLHWQTLWSTIRRLSILKAANRIARDRLNGYNLPSDSALIGTPWFI